LQRKRTNAPRRRAVWVVEGSRNCDGLRSLLWSLQWKDLKYSAGITITTYTMVAHSGRRSYEAQMMMDFLTTTEWGLVILDEVHVVPADVFRKVVSTVPAHCKLGLTGTGAPYGTVYGSAHISRHRVSPDAGCRPYQPPWCARTKRSTTSTT